MSNVRLKNIFWLFLLVTLCWPCRLPAGINWFFNPQYQYVQPLGSLKHWFKGSATSYAFALGWKENEQWQYAINFKIIPFDEPNKSELKYDDLSVKLEISVLTVESRYFLRTVPKRFNPFILWDIGLYRWFAERGSYLISEQENSEPVFVPGRNQNDWSWGFGLGGGANLILVQNFSLSFHLEYNLLIAELWPALALDLENVSGLQTLIANLGFIWYF